MALGQNFYFCRTYTNNIKLFIAKCRMQNIEYDYRTYDYRIYLF